MLEQSRLLRIEPATGEPALGKAQRRFNTLVKKAAKLKDGLRAWQQAQSEIARGIGEFERLRAEHQALIAALVRRLDDRHADPALTKAERAKLSRIICETAYDVLTAGGPEDLKAIYNRRSKRDFDIEVARDHAEQAAMMRDVLEDIGVQLDGDIGSLDQLREAAFAQLDERDRMASERARAAEEKRARRKKSARQLASEQRRESEQTQASKAIQDIYRKLALALHPDHEPDPDERTRKTQLMQEVNVAYEAKDLLQLLELQLRFEQVDQARINTLAADRLDHFNRLLGEQVRQLQQELADTELPWRMQLDLPPPIKLTAAYVLTELRDDLRGMTLDLTTVRRDHDAFADVRALKVFLRGR